jgi:D-arabinose 1-dehydrogenase-like Zn-dependent alcohol dehydrogenase
MHELMDLVKAGVVNPIPITPRPMAEINDALNDLQAGRVLGRVVFTP